MTSDATSGSPKALYDIAYVNGLMDERNALRDEVDRLDRLPAAPVDDRERVPEGWRVEWTPTPELEFDPPADVPRLVRK